MPDADLVQFVGVTAYGTGSPVTVLYAFTGEAHKSDGAQVGARVDPDGTTQCRL